MIKFNLPVSLFVALFVTHSVQANVTWAFNPSNCLDCTYTNGKKDINYKETYGNSHIFGSSSNSVTVSAFSTTADINKFETAHLTQWSGGLGVRSRKDGGINNVPEHAMDNEEGIDVVKISSIENISLTSAEIGWKSDDSDISVLAHDGKGDNSLVNKTFAELLDNGWDFIGHYSNLKVNTTDPKKINKDEYFSSDWLITAYSPEAGSPDSWTFGNDFFKLSKLTGKVSQPGSGSVPEPSSILLLLLAMIGWKISNNGSNRFDSSP